MNFKESARYQKAIQAFDALNAQDPNQLEIDGILIAKELHDAEAMTRWIEVLYPDAGEAVYLAARCQHLCRWEMPRKTYPEGRAGYLKWRGQLKQFHAEKSGEVLWSVGYDATIVDQVMAINLKKGLKQNEDVQQIEDALCLVFLETQFEGYIDKWETEKIIGILQKTWGKMSETAHAAALELSLSDRALGLVKQALS